MLSAYTFRFQNKPKMKKLMIAAFALTMLGGAEFAQKATTNTTAKQEVKKETKATTKHKKAHTKKADKAEKMEKTEVAK
jgi:Ni/Co efflux regulator RcnB